MSEYNKTFRSIHSASDSRKIAESFREFKANFVVAGASRSKHNSKGGRAACLVDVL